MLLETTVENNGYGCSCCAHDWKNSKWIHEDEIKSLKVLIDELYSEQKKLTDDHYHTHYYEKDGSLIYGYKCESYGRAGETINFHVGPESIRVMNVSSKVISKENLLEWAEEKIA